MRHADAKIASDIDAACCPFVCCFVISSPFFNFTAMSLSKAGLSMEVAKVTKEQQPLCPVIIVLLVRCLRCISLKNISKKVKRTCLHGSLNGTTWGREHRAAMQRWTFDPNPFILLLK